MSETGSSTPPCCARVSRAFLFIGFFILILDQLSKGVVYAYLPTIDASDYWYPYGGIGVFKDVGGIEFSINHMTNTGAAWGVFGGHQLILIVLRAVLIVSLIIYLFYFNRNRSWQLPLILVVAGALGNVIDFFLYRHVIDMFHFVFFGYDFPVFNIADSAISVGIASLFFLSLGKNSPEEEN